MAIKDFFTGAMNAMAGKPLTPAEQQFSPVYEPIYQAIAAKKMEDAGNAQISAGEQALAEMRAQNAVQQEKLQKQTATLDDEARKRAEQQAATGRARRRGGARALLSAFRLNPEQGLGGADSPLGPG